MTEENKLSRRNFFVRAGQNILLANLASELINPSAARASEKFDLKQLEADTERQDAKSDDPMAPDKRLGVAVVGLGHLSLEEIIPALAQCKKVRLAALVSGHAEKAKTIAAQTGLQAKNIYSYENFDSIKNDSLIDFVYIVLPNSMHCEFTVRAAKAGKHVLSEKPMATSVKDCQTMIDVCKQANRKLMIAYRIQYEPMNRMMRSMARSKQYGKVKMIEASNSQNQGDPTQWRQNRALSGGGALPDIGIYCLNTIRSMLGEEPSEVYATTYSTPNDPRFTEVEESIAFQLTFPSGLLANCSSSYGVHENRSYRAFAETGWFGMDPAFAYSGLQMQVSHAKGSTEYLQTPKLSAVNQFAIEMDHMADCILQNRQPFTPGEEGLQDQRLIEALYQSAAERRPVKTQLITSIDTYRGPQPVDR